MPGKQRQRTPYNENWEAEIAAYDRSCDELEREFRARFMVIDEGGHTALSDDENEVLKLVLNGLSCTEIAMQAKVDPDEVVALLEIIRAKLSLEEWE